MKTQTDQNRYAKQYQLSPAQKVLMACGILSSLLYASMNVIGAALYEGYSSTSQTVSELSAIDAPTRPLWVGLGVVYALLILAFALGVWQLAAGNRRLRVVGILLFAYGSLSIYWPPMHQREVLSAGGGTLTDTLHIVFTIVTVPLMIAAIGFGAAAFKRGFRIYSIITLLILAVFGILTGLDGPSISKNLATPLIGVWERINIGAFLIWVIALAIMIVQNRRSSVTEPRPGDDVKNSFMAAKPTDYHKVKTTGEAEGS